MSSELPKHCCDCLLSRQFADPAEECPGSPDRKADLRRVVLESLSSMTPEVRRSKSRRIVKHLLEFEPFKRAETLMAYVAMEMEVDPWTLVREAWALGKRVVLPRIHPPLEGPKVPSDHNHHLRAFELRQQNVDDPQDHADLRPDMMGILEPKESAAEAHVRDIDLVVVPCVAYDRRGCRLGRGGGFYDRFLAHGEFRGLAVGLAFSEQVFKSLPTCPHDQAVAYVATESGILQTGGNGSRSNGAG